jgi:tetratricopeptide (TPR) repeat protein
VGDRRTLQIAREAVALDSTFASAWSLLGAALSNYGGTRSAIDSALTQAYRYRERLPAREREMLVGRYYAMGPGRDRRKAIAAYTGIIASGDSVPSVMVNLGEQLRTRREYARAESLNIAAARLMPSSGTALGNAVELQLDQGKYDDAAATLARLNAVAPQYAASRELFLAFARGDEKTLRAKSDSLLRLTGPRRGLGLVFAGRLALRDGRLRVFQAYRREGGFTRAGPLPGDDIFEMMVDAAITGPSPSRLALLDSAIARVPFRELPMVDRPYLLAASALARFGSVEKARAMIARYRAEMTDSLIAREQEPQLHETLGEIALAAGKPQEALAEFSRSDIAYDGAPARECAPCLPFNLARAYDAAGKADSAAMMFERYLATPYWFKAVPDMDPVRVPAIRERLGQLYESMGNTEKAVENYRAFIELWKNADPELQPRVNDARQRLAKLTPVEKGRP